MKIVINVCFGGYSLSPKAVKRLAEIQGKECYFYEGGLSKKYDLIEGVPDARSMFCSAFTISNEKELNSILKKSDEWHILTDKQKDDFNTEYDAISLSMNPDDRTDKQLIQVIEELGDEANGSCAKLKIVEIPDDIKWLISDYDGIEEVEEVHRSWS